jgi:hypothetical protein
MKPLNFLTRILAAVAAGVLAALALAGAYTESHRVPGQP